jgi:hypothetical protein
MERSADGLEGERIPIVPEMPTGRPELRHREPLQANTISAAAERFDWEFYRSNTF